MALSAPETLAAHHDENAFSCGKPALDDWLKKRARSNQRKGFTSVAVVHDQGHIVGYYGLAPTAVAPATLPRAIRTGQPPDPLPCLLLGQLAVDKGWEGRGVGTGLLKHALLRCAAASRLIGGRALIVKAIDEEALAFWTRRGFLATRDDRFTLFRPLADIVASVSVAQEKGPNGPS